jgi:hypothetical protein
MLEHWLIYIQKTYFIEARYVFICYIIHHRNYYYVDYFIRNGAYFSPEFKKLSNHILKLFWEDKLTSPLFQTLTLEEINLMTTLYLEGDNYPLSISHYKNI